MSREPEIDMTKTDTPVSNQDTGGVCDRLTKQHDELVIICHHLSESTSSFNPEVMYKIVQEYKSNYGRWQYSVISNYLFTCRDEDSGAFMSNLEKLRTHTYTITAPEGQGQDMERFIDKLWDHSNLAQIQNHNFHADEGAFQTSFDKCILPFKAKFSADMNMQFISLIAIFTALSFIVFGGISSLNNIIGRIDNVPILELVIMGCIWSCCISNLVFVFMYFVSKLTRVPIKATTKSNASISEKYPFIIWCNYFLILILVVASFFYYIDHANLGGWLSASAKNHEMAFSCGGLGVIGIVFGVVAGIMMKKRK